MFHSITLGLALSLFLNTSSSSLATPHPEDLREFWRNMHSQNLLEGLNNELGPEVLNTLRWFIHHPPSVPHPPIPETPTLVVVAHAAAGGALSYAVERAFQSARRVDEPSPVNDRAFDLSVSSNPLSTVDETLSADKTPAEEVSTPAAYAAAASAKVGYEVAKWAHERYKGRWERKEETFQNDLHDFDLPENL